MDNLSGPLKLLGPDINFVCKLIILVVVVTDVGFAIGGDSDIRYLVLQVHYASVDTFRGKNCAIFSV